MIESLQNDLEHALKSQNLPVIEQIEPHVNRKKENRLVRQIFGSSGAQQRTKRQNKHAWKINHAPKSSNLFSNERKVYNYTQQYSVLSGEMIGEMPVGIQTFDNEDDPYWSQLNNATYKEVWVGVAGKWLSILVDLYNIKEEI